MRKNKILSLIIVLAMIVSLVPAVIVGAAAEDTAGTTAAQTHKIAVTQDTESGSTIKVSATEAKEYDSVKITVNFLAGSKLDILSVKTASGKYLPVYSNEEGYSFSMPAEDVTVSVKFAAFGTPETMPFTDVTKEDKFYDAVYYCYVGKYMDGVSDTLFDPNGTLTRAMAVTILWRDAGEPADAAASGFADVASGSWYEKAVNWAVANKITNGKDATHFDPEGILTNEEAVVFLYREAGYFKDDTSVGEDTNILSYKDIAEVDEWAIAAYQWACGMNIVKADGDMLRPTEKCTRANMADMFSTYLKAYGMFE